MANAFRAQTETERDGGDQTKSAGHIKSKKKKEKLSNASLLRLTAFCEWKTQVSGMGKGQLFQCLYASSSVNELIEHINTGFPVSKHWMRAEC